MPRRKRRSRERREELSVGQYFDLTGSRSRTVDSFRPVFESGILRKTAWYAHREKLMTEWIEEHPGDRPGAWWAYEHPNLERLDEEEDWEYLLRAGELSKEEVGRVLSEWVRRLFLYMDYLCSVYPDEPVYHGNPSWEEEKTKYERQAALLGPQAQKEWQEVVEQITGAENE